MPRPRTTIQQAKLRGYYRPSRHGRVGDTPRGAFGDLKKPRGLPKPVASVWDRYVSKATWLDASREPEAIMFCHLFAEFEADPPAFTAGKLGQLRSCMSKLGLSDEHERKTNIAPLDDHDDEWAIFLDD